MSFSVSEPETALSLTFKCGWSDGMLFRLPHVEACHSTPFLPFRHCLRFHAPAAHAAHPPFDLLPPVDSGTPGSSTATTRTRRKERRCQQARYRQRVVLFSGRGRRRSTTTLCSCYVLRVDALPALVQPAWHMRHKYLPLGDDEFQLPSRRPR